MTDEPTITTELTIDLITELNAPNMQNQVALALPTGPTALTIERFTRIITTQCRLVPELTNCTRESFMGAVLGAAALGLEIGLLGQANMIPFKNREAKTVECTLVIGYQGYLDLLYRTGLVASVSSEIVYSVDAFDYGLGASPFVTHKPPSLGDVGFAQRNKDNAIGAYTVVELISGQKFIKVMDRTEILNHRDRAPSKKFWDHPQNYQWMWKKTTIMQCLKLAPKSVTKNSDIAIAAENNPSALAPQVVGAIDATATPVTGLDQLSNKLEDK